MATKKDLVEAHSFSRRRLVTAFVSGAPGGREVEPSRPGRTLVGGAALAVLLLAGAAIAGALRPDVDVDWTQPGLVQSQEKGASFVILEPDEEGNPQVRPVINVTSAQLILGEDATPEVVPQSEIDEIGIGADIGILGAPVTVPETEDLIQTGWTACTGTDRGLRLRVSEAPSVTATPGAGSVVRSNGVLYVVAQSSPTDPAGSRAYRYALPRDLPGLDNLLDALGLPIQREAATVPGDWLDLLPEGGALELDSLGVAGFGGPSPQAGQGGLPADARIGDYYEIDGDSSVLTAQGPADLSAVARAVFLNSTLPGTVRDLGLTDPPTLTKASPPYDRARWPEQVLEPVVGEQCVQLRPAPGEVPGVVLVQPEGDDPSAAEVEDGAREVSVDPGGGAFVLAGGWDSPDVGEPFVVDGKGFSYALIGTDAIENLGFGGYDTPVVPDSWLELFGAGEALSVDAALCPPIGPSDDEPPGDVDAAGDPAGDSAGGQARTCE